jgi:meso-butanediol dehydrogenase/(S,S)-butanediol dehydrogenase/diacetyl reductase
MSRRLEGQVATVTGAGQGIGQGVALALAKDGAAVAIVGRTESTIVDTCELIQQAGGRAIPIVCDVTDVAQIDACVATVVESLGGLDILIDNAQVSPHGPIAETTDATMLEAFESGPIAAFRFMRTGYPYLWKRPGVVINMGSEAQMINEGMNYRIGPYLIAKYAMLP